MVVAIQTPAVDPDVLPDLEDPQHLSWTYEDLNIPQQIRSM